MNQRSGPDQPRSPPGPRVVRGSIGGLLPEVAELIAADPVVPGATDFLCNVRPAAPALSAIRASLELFAETVIADLR